MQKARKSKARWGRQKEGGNNQDRDRRETDRRTRQTRQEGKPRPRAEGANRQAESRLVGKVTGLSVLAGSGSGRGKSAVVCSG